MSLQEFIFSENPRTRITRHLVFWMAFALHVFFFRFYTYDPVYYAYLSTYIVRFKNLLFFLPASFFYAYFSLYFLLPRYILPGKYMQLPGIVLLVVIITLILSYAVSILFNIKLAWDIPANRADVVKQIDFTFNNGIVYPLTVSAFAIAVKMSKNFYLKQKENTALSIQKINAGVQLLKSQVHARFLFHSLKTIRQDLLDGEGRSPEMLMRLSELLSYILYESDKMMPLEKELLLLNNYIGLEKISWGNRLIIKTTGRVNPDEQLIEPLLLLPLAEYIFDNLEKHRQDTIILDLEMNTGKGLFHFLVNVSGIAAMPATGFEIDTHLLQVQKRLLAQYQHKHQLVVSNRKNGVSISLELHTSKADTTMR